jgi:hypothetical protein
MSGTIRHRLLINALVDPDEAASHLPIGLRPHVVDGATVVGCCLLDIEGIRPASLPAAIGIRLRAAAHRISIEWESEAGVTTVGVYVPIRHTASRTARALGGRWFPGVHRKAAIELTDDGRRVRWSVEPSDRTIDCAVSVSASITSASPTTHCGPIAATCLHAMVGLSPNQHGALEAARMEPDHQRALQVETDGVVSQFVRGFTTAQWAPSYLMRDVDVTWTKVVAPRLAIESQLTARP